MLISNRRVHSKDIRTIRHCWTGQAVHRCLMRMNQRPPLMEKMEKAGSFPCLPSTAPHSRNPTLQVSLISFIRALSLTLKESSYVMLKAADSLSEPNSQ